MQSREAHQALPGPDRPRAAWVTTAVATFATWALGACVFFWAQVTTGFDRLMGNDGDTRLIVYLNEHWFHVLRGSTAWRDPAMFYPIRGILGYSDTFFLWQPFYATFRIFGAEPFLAFQLTIVALSLLGFATFVALVRTAFGCTRVVAMVGALVFTFASSLETHAGSPQLFGMYFVPGIVFIALIAWRQRNAHPARSAALGAGAGLLAGILLFSTYYVAWFSLLATGVALLVTFLLSPRAGWARGRRAVTTGWRVLLAGGVGFGVGLVPFLVTYLPVVHTVGARKYGTAMYFAPAVHDVVNLTTDNRVWGRLLESIWNLPSNAAYEVSYAVTPLLLASVTLGALLLGWSAWSGRAVLDARRRFTVALCLTPIILTILPIRTSAGSVWVLVWHLPGATAIRAADRLQVVSDLVAALALVALASDPWLRGALARCRPWVRVLAALLLVGVVVEQVSLPTTSSLHRTDEIATLAAVPPAPHGCTTFFVVDRPGRIPFYADLTEAMLISQRQGIPTLDGYSGETPPGWNLLLAPGQVRDLDSYAQVWANSHGILSGVCRLDLETDTWQGPYPNGW